MVKVVADARPRGAPQPARGQLQSAWRGSSIDDGHGHVRGTAQIRRGLDRIASEARDPCRKRHSRCELNSASRRIRRRTGPVATKATHAAPSASLLCFQRKAALSGEPDSSERHASNAGPSEPTARLHPGAAADSLSGLVHAQGAVDRDASPLARRRRASPLQASRRLAAEGERRDAREGGTPPVLERGRRILHGRAIHRCNRSAFGTSR